MSSGHRLTAYMPAAFHEVEGFLDEMLVLLPILGINAFETPATQSTDSRKKLYCSGTDY
jgi:hypothetical protein